MIVNAIVAVGNQGQIGINNTLPWHDSNDLKWFKELTTGGICIVGYRTYQTLPKLKDRLVVLDNNKVDAETFIKSLEHHNKPIWVIGGSATYKRYAHLIDRWHIGKIDYNGPADTYFDSSIVFKGRSNECQTNLLCSDKLHTV